MDVSIPQGLIFFPLLSDTVRSLNYDGNETREGKTVDAAKGFSANRAGIVELWLDSCLKIAEL